MTGTFRKNRFAVKCISDPESEPLLQNLQAPLVIVHPFCIRYKLPAKRPLSHSAPAKVQRGTGAFVVSAYFIEGFFLRV
jgi:hypothetical protein